MSVQKTVRIPDDLLSWIDSLPYSYGKDVSNKIITLLYREMEAEKYERELLALSKTLLEQSRRDSVEVKNEIETLKREKADLMDMTETLRKLIQEGKERLSDS